MKFFLKRVLRNAGAVAAVVGVDFALGLNLPVVGGFPLVIVAAPLLNGLAKLGRDNLDDGLAARLAKLF